MFNIDVKLTLNETHKKFIVKNHYLKSARSLKSKYVFELHLNNTLVGVAVFGQPCGKNVISKYGSNTLELRRFCLSKICKKNTASYFMSRCLKYLKIKGINNIITYSDPNQGHLGTIYKASNFEYIGKEANANPRLFIYGKKRIHLRQMYQKDKFGNYYPSALEYQQKLSKGEIICLKQQRKDIFIYRLNSDRL